MSFYVAGATLVSAGASLYGSSKQASADQNAANQQMAMFNTIQKNNQPYMQAGSTALNSIMSGLNSGGQFNSSFTPQDFLNNQDPGYAFQLQQGGQAVRNADTASGGALGGAAVKDLMSFNSGLAAQSYQNAYNRWLTTNNTIFGRLSGIAGLGQASANNTAASGTTLAGNAGSATAAAGAATAGGISAAGNSIANAGLPLSYLMSINGGGGNVNGTNPGYLSSIGATGNGPGGNTAADQLGPEYAQSLGLGS